MAERRSGGAPQRRTRSREALIAATQEFLAHGETDFTVADIAADAGVVLQTLYNHFNSKEALVAAAVEAAMATWEADMLACTRELADPLEQLAANMRLFARMPDTHPRLTAIFVHGGGQALAGPRGYTEQALAHVRSIEAAGLIKPANLELALMTTVVSTQRLMVLRATDTSRGKGEVDELVAQNLLIFRVPPQTIRKLLARPLPKIRTERESGK